MTETSVRSGLRGQDRRDCSQVCPPHPDLTLGCHLYLSYLIPGSLFELSYVQAQIHLLSRIRRLRFPSPIRSLSGLTQKQKSTEHTGDLGSRWRAPAGPRGGLRLPSSWWVHFCLQNLMERSALSVDTLPTGYSGNSG